jgi:hypothetical protein
VPVTAAATSLVPVESDLRRLAEFVGRLYLLLVTVVYDHPRWLPPELRSRYQAALAEVSPNVQRLQATLLNPNLDPRGADEVMRLLQEAGLSGLQLGLKLAAYRGPEAFFYGRRRTAAEVIPDRRFGDQGEQIWMIVDVRGEAPPHEATRGGGKPRSPALLEAPLEAADIVLGTLLSVFQLAESYKEIKEGVQFGVKNWRLFRRIRNGASWIGMKLRGG